MGLDIYREVSTGVYAKHKQDSIDDGSLPITTTHDGVLGETVILKLFVRGDINTEWYEDISLIPISIVTPNEVDGTSTGYGVKLIAGDTEPTEAEWDATDYASSISLANIGTAIAGDTNTYLPFWCRQECPAGVPADNRENTSLRLSYTANPV
jgi:hypothetical protein